MRGDHRRKETAAPERHPGNNGNACGWRRTRAKYKCHLAATLFADVLRKGQTQEESAGKKQGEEDTQQQDKDMSPKRSDGEAPKTASSLTELSIKDIPEQLYGKYEKIKEEQPEAVVLFKHENKYYASMYDAETVANGTEPASE